MNTIQKLQWAKILANELLDTIDSTIKGAPANKTDSKILADVYTSMAHASLTREYVSRAHDKIRER